MSDGPSDGGTGRRNDDPKDDPEAVKPDLLDFLFTLALMVGLAPELLGRGFGGILSWNWALQVPSAATAFDFSVFLLGLLTLTFSWYGFNASVHRRPVLYGSASGMARFVLDAILIVLYGFVLLTFERFGVVFFVLVVVFLLYTVWDWLKVFEYRKQPWVDPTVAPGGGDVDVSRPRWYLRELRDRESLDYFFVLAVAFLLYLGSRWLDATHLVDWAFLGVLFIATTRYRLEKMNWQLRGKRSVVERIEDNG